VKQPAWTNVRFGSKADSQKTNALVSGPR